MERAKHIAVFLLRVVAGLLFLQVGGMKMFRSEERRVGKELRFVVPSFQENTLCKNFAFYL